MWARPDVSENYSARKNMPHKAHSLPIRIKKALKNVDAETYAHTEFNLSE